jgi:multiple sugar transport system ATP-binding protein
VCQQQRVAIARALVKMLEYYCSMNLFPIWDARLRLKPVKKSNEFKKKWHYNVFVTHDQEEAMSISDLIVVMKLGVVQQIGHPQAVYDDPTNLFVAKFLGTPPINVFNGHVENGMVYIGTNPVLQVKGVTNQDVYVGIRPEGFIPSEKGTLECEVTNLEVMGRDLSIVSKHEAAISPIIRSIIDADDMISGSLKIVKYSVKPNKIFLFSKETEERIRFEVE